MEGIVIGEMIIRGKGDLFWGVMGGVWMNGGVLGLSGVENGVGVKGDGKMMRRGKVDMRGGGGFVRF